MPTSLKLLQAATFRKRVAFRSEFRQYCWEDEKNRVDLVDCRRPRDGSGPMRNPTQSPASRPCAQNGRRLRRTQSRRFARRGASGFTSRCGFCTRPRRAMRHGETGPDLTRSKLVAEDTRGDKLGPLLRAGAPDQSMLWFKLNETDLRDIVAFIHDQKTKSEALGGGRRSVEAEDLATGNAESGRAYFNRAGSCASCHSATGDLAGVASRYKGLTLLQRMLYPGGRPAPARPKVTVTLPSGQTVVRDLASEDEFSIVTLDPSGVRQTYEKNAVKYKVDDPLSAHFLQLGKYTDDDMHNVFAYLDTLK